MKELYIKTKEVLNSKLESIINDIDSGMKLVKEVVNGLPIFVSVERDSSSTIFYDEKHYFVVPFLLSDTGFSLHTMRSLPPNVNEVNDLPKRRIFHFPNEHYEGTLRKYMLDTAINLTYQNSAQNQSSIQKLANDIDALDNKLTYGMLLVGGIAAIFNPLVGAGIAAKALLPSVSGLFSKHGLRPLGEKINRVQLEKKAKQAQEHVLKQFAESNTIKVVNPILSELEFALSTNEEQHDPLSDPNLANGSIKELDNENWRELTEKAIYHIYKDTVANKKLHKGAGLGPEDLRWLKLIFTGHEN
jgi:hypothetical protein